MMRCHHHTVATPVKIENTYNKYYISITAPNAIGIIAKIGTICASKNISLSSILQKGVEANNTAEITVITENCLEKSIKEIVSELDDCTINSVIRVMG
jgi:predicted regulator of amino acid metabolism with ACT domain